MKKLFVALVIVAAMAVSLSTSQTASADVTLVLPNGNVMYGLPDGAINAVNSGGAITGSTCPPNCDP